MTGRQYLISQAYLHLIDHEPDRLDDLRVWEIVEETILQIKAGIKRCYSGNREVLRYWDTSLSDGDCRAANMLIKAIQKKVSYRTSLRKAVENERH